jgi:phage regulator Rha-like protein
LFAEKLSKRHADVLRDTKALGCSAEFNQRNFALVKYSDAKGEQRPQF